MLRPILVLGLLALVITGFIKAWYITATIAIVFAIVLAFKPLAEMATFAICALLNTVFGVRAAEAFASFSEKCMGIRIR